MAIPDRITAVVTTAVGSEPIADVIFSPDGTSVVTLTASGSVARWSIPDLAPVEVVDMQGRGSHRLAVGFDGTLAIAGRAGLVVGHHRVSLVPTSSAAFRPGHAALVAGHADGVVLRIGTGALMRPTWHAPAALVTDLALSSDGSLLAATTANGFVILADPDGDTVRVWSLRVFSNPPRLHGCAFAAGGDPLAVSTTFVKGGPLGTTRDPDLYEIVLLDPTSDEEPDFRSTLVGHTARVSAIARQPGGLLLASGGHDQRIRLWDVDSRILVAESGLLGAPVGRVAFAPDGRLVAAVSDDGVLALYDPARTTSAHGDGSPVRADDLVAELHGLAAPDPARFVLVGDRLADQLLMIDSPEVRRSVMTRVATAFQDHLDRLMMSFEQILNIRRERALREGDPREGALYNVLIHQAVSAAWPVRAERILRGESNSAAGSAPRERPDVAEALAQYARDGVAPAVETVLRTLSPVDATEISEALGDVIRAAVQGDPALPHATDALQLWFHRVLDVEPMIARITAWCLAQAFERLSRWPEALDWGERAATIIARAETDSADQTLATAIESTQIRLLRKAGRTAEAEERTARFRAAVEAMDLSEKARRELMNLTESSGESSATPTEGFSLADALQVAGEAATEGSAALLGTIRRVVDGVLTVAEATDATERVTGGDLAVAAIEFANDVSAAIDGRADPMRAAEGVRFLLAIAGRDGHSRMASALASDIGTLHGVAERDDEAVEWLERARDWAHPDEVPHYICLLHGNLGNAYCNVERFRQALESFGTGLRIAREQGLARLEAQHLSNRAVVYRVLGDERALLSDLHHARGIARIHGFDAELAKIAHGLGGSYWRTGDLASAEQAQQESVELSARTQDDLGRCKSLCDLGWIRIERGKFEEGATDLATANAIAERIGLPSVQASFQVHLARQQWEADDITGARERFDQATELAEQAGVARLLETLVEFGDFETAVDSPAAGEEKWQAAVAVGRRSRGHVRDGFEPIGVRLRRAYQRLIEVRLSRGDARGAFELLMQSTGRTEFGRAAGHTTAAAVADVLADIGPHTVLAAAIAVDDHVRLLVISAGAAEVTLIDTGLSRSAVEQLRQAFEREVRDAPRYGHPRETWHLAGCQLVDALRPHLHPDCLVYLVPGESLEGLPLHALGSDSQRLLHLCAVAYLPAIDALLDLAVPEPLDPPASALAVGAHFVDEAREVSELLTGCTLIAGEQVDREEVLSELASAEVVHISAHGFFDAEDPLTSGAVLTWTPELSRYLELRAIPGWLRRNDAAALVETARPARATLLTATDLDRTIPARLVCLSACESGLVGIDATGDRVGMVPALLGAGVPTVVAGLWRVDAETTKKMMVEFYGELVAGGWREPPQIALRRAALRLSADYGSYFWAAFVTIGGVLRRSRHA
jgi:CHAT domain-containing protein